MGHVPFATRCEPAISVRARRPSPSPSPVLASLHPALHHLITHRTSPNSQSRPRPPRARAFTIPRPIYVLAALLFAAVYWFSRPTAPAPAPIDVPATSSAPDTSPSPSTTSAAFRPLVVPVPMAAPLKHLKVLPKDAHTATVIFLHGLGDTGHGWLPVAKMLWSSLPNVKWILPHAPSIPITVNGGMRMPGWFDVITFDRSQVPRPEDEPGILATVEAVDKLIQAEVDAGVPEDRIVLGGFSQGGAIAALSMLTKKRNLAGYVSLSTWVPLAHKVEGLVRDNVKDQAMFWGHGREDEIVPFEYGMQSVELLKKLGLKVLPAGETFARPGLRVEAYRGMGHSSCPEELAHLQQWLAAALK